MRAVEGAEDAEGMGVRGERMQPLSPDPHHYPLNPAEARTCINYLVDRGGTYLPSLPPRLHVHPMSNVQLHHTSHSHYIRRHNVGVRAQHASSSRSPSLTLHPCDLRASFWISRKESFNCQSAGASTRRAGEKDKERGGGGIY